MASKRTRYVVTIEPLGQNGPIESIQKKEVYATTPLNAVGNAYTDLEAVGGTVYVYEVLSIPKGIMVQMRRAGALNNVVSDISGKFATLYTPVMKVEQLTFAE